MVQAPSPAYITHTTDKLNLRTGIVALQGTHISHNSAKKSVLICYRVAVGAATHWQPKFLSLQKLPPIPPPPLGISHGAGTIEIGACTLARHMGLLSRHPIPYMNNGGNKANFARKNRDQIERCWGEAGGDFS